jgi:VanZ family protein
MRHFYFTFFWIVCILFLCLIDTKELPSVSYLELLEFDKIVHIILFGLLVLSLTIALRKQSVIRWIRNNAMLIALAFSILYGCVIESIQFFVVPERTGEFDDILANVIGSVLGIVFFRFIYGKQLFRAS